MIKITDKSACSGCSACASICPHDAISMEPDALGFLYPETDMDRCTGCGLCEKVCVFGNGYDTAANLPEPEAYAVRHKNPGEVETSRSGAAFIALSDHILDRGGAVYGAGYTGHFRVVHKRAVTREERDEFKGSKYVQSDLTGVFRQVRKDLSGGLEVMFSGTPCQTAGLAAYIGKGLRARLFLVDIICHGVPGPYVWRDYLAYIERRHGDRVCRVDFRDKVRFGWAAHRETYSLEHGGEVSSGDFSFLYQKNIISRLSCGVCPFANTRRTGDLTLGDLWGWEKVLPPQANADDKGISLVLANTMKGRSLLASCTPDIDITPVPLEECLQDNLLHPSRQHRGRMRFETIYRIFGFRCALALYGETGILSRISRAASKKKNNTRR